MKALYVLYEMLHCAKARRRQSVVVHVDHAPDAIATKVVRELRRRAH